MWKYLRVVPKKGDANNTWYIPFQVDTTASLQVLSYISLLDEGAKKHNFSKAENVLKKVKAHQRKIGSNVVPTESAVSMEISYNKMEVFKHSYQLLLSLGFLLLIISFIGIFKSSTSRFSKIQIWSNRIIIGLLVVTFLYLAAGLGMRWVISGHAPWSDAYESILFVAWATVAFGIIFGRKSYFTLASATFVSSIMLYVASLNWLDPSIANLQPVLDSYWLMIHVAVIVGSYGPFAIGMILGVVVLLLTIMANKKNKKAFSRKLEELTIVIELSLTIGLVMLTIGNFLGGMWANESWGRYWGWDPKETWALISIIIYTAVLHLRIVPKLNNKWLFNLMSIISFAAIMMTYFGVNFYLVGLHSYASGDRVITPDFVYYSIVFVTLLGLISYFANKKNQVL